MLVNSGKGRKSCDRATVEEVPRLCNGIKPLNGLGKVAARKFMTVLSRTELVERYWLGMAFRTFVLVERSYARVPMEAASATHRPENSRCALNFHPCTIPFTRWSGGMNVRPRTRNVAGPRLAPGGSGTPKGKGLNRLLQVAHAGASVSPLSFVGTMFVDCEKPDCCTPSMIKGSM